jgi:hypothetical protein
VVVRGAPGVVLEGGTLTSSAGPRCGLPVLHALTGMRGPESGWGVRFVGTLLGPERAGHSFGGDCDLVSGPVCFSYRCAPRGVVRVWWGRVTGVWSYVENCTVDASIF